jgi:LemA protein
MVLWALALVALLALTAIAYNGLVRLRTLAENAWSDIDVQLKRRHELVPNLVATVKGYAAHEQSTFAGVVDARNRAAAAAGPAAAGRAEAELAGALRQLFALAEAYPQLRAADNFLSLQTALAEIEDHVQNARRYYNAVVRDLNTRTQQVPTNVVARLFGFRQREFFELEDDAQRSAPRVDLSPR